MDSWPKRITALASKPIAVPLALLAVTLLAYGLFFWRLGLYWDDQPISWIRYQLGTEATTKYFSDSRPVWALLYQLTGVILPLQPALWQVFAMFWRWTGVFALYLVSAAIFPRRKDMAFILSLLVLLYPGFNQQWVSYLYSHFFIVLFFLFFSWYLMLRGKTTPAMIFSALNLLMFEYFFLLELIRPVIIFLSLRGQPLTIRAKLVKSVKAWLPYVGVIGFVILYRSLVYSHPGFGYSLTEEVARKPIETIFQLLQSVISSLWAATGGAWMRAFEFPSVATNGLRTSMIYAFVVLAVGALVFLVRRVLRDTDDENKSRDARWLIGIGVVTLILGGVPYWVTNLPVSLGFPANRALLSFTFGSCFLLMGLIDLFPVQIKYPVAILLLALSAGRQFLWSVDYLRDWESQKNLFWQMTWRAPAIAPNTLVLLNEELSYNADNSIGAAVNWIYDPETTSNPINYAIFYPGNRLGGSLPSLEPDIPIRYGYYAGDFQGNTSQALAFYYDPPYCLRLLDPDLDSNNRFIPFDSLMRDAAALSNPERILRGPAASMPSFYGAEPHHGWCYYFQKAELARQFGEWEEVNTLAEAAFELDEHFNNPVELFVFIEGYAHAGDWNEAVKLSKEARQVSKSYVDPLLCKLWKRIEADTDPSAGKDEALAEIFELTGCEP